VTFCRKIDSMRDVLDTIVAIATPPGRGGIGVVRLSGRDATAIGRSLLRSAGEFVAGRAQFGYLLDREPGQASASVLDEVVTTFFAGPKSYTGEDVLEISAHGAPVVLEAVVRGAIQLGARLAEPGEFTQRAFLSGRLDLTQAEAVHDLISATTLHQARVAASQMGGALSRTVHPSKTELIRLIATLEAGIDFAEDDLDLLPNSEIESKIAVITLALARLEGSYRYGKALREGRSLAIVGRPNAGKSSLFNALLDRDRAIVTSTPGTTRDVISERTAFEGIPVEITDTAGIRETTEEIEALGIARSREVLADAALVLLVVDGTSTLDAADTALLAEIAGRPAIVALNKCDLVPDKGRTQLIASMAEIVPGLRAVHVSAQTGEGLEDLRGSIHTALTGEGAVLDSVFLTSERQHGAVTAARQSLASADAAIHEQIPHEMILLDLHAALDALDALTGTTTTDDVLSLIFSTFCIGK